MAYENTYKLNTVVHIKLKTNNICSLTVFGSGLYLIANLGPGPRDGLMTGLTKKTQLPIALIRATLEISAVISGWYLGGTVGLGTIIFAFGIGPAVALGIYIVDKVTK